MKTEFLLILATFFIAIVLTIYFYIKNRKIITTAKKIFKIQYLNFELPTKNSLMNVAILLNQPYQNCLTRLTLKDLIIFIDK